MTERGFEVLTQDLEMDTWVVDISNDSQAVNQKFFLMLDKSVDWPYFIDGKKKKIYFFSSKEATMATLYGDVGAWLSSK